MQDPPYCKRFSRRPPATVGFDGTGDPHPTIFIPNRVRLRHRREIRHFPGVGIRVFIGVELHPMEVKVGSADLYVARSFYKTSKSVPTIDISDDPTHSMKAAWITKA